MPTPPILNVGCGVIASNCPSFPCPLPLEVLIRQDRHQEHGSFGGSGVYRRGSVFVVVVVVAALNAPVYLGRPAYAISTFGRLLGLCDIATQIIDQFYLTIRVKMSKVDAAQSINKIRLSLEQWKTSLPPKLRFEPGIDAPPPPHQITLQ